MKKKVMKESTAWQIGAHTVMIIGSLLAILPFILLVIASFTDNQTALVNGYSFTPEKWSLEAYQYIASEWATIGRAYLMTILVTVIGTALSLVITSTFAFAVSNDKLPGHKILMFLCIFTMLFNGGLVASYYVYSNIFHIKNTIWALIVPTFLMSPFNVVLVKNYFSNSISPSILEAARMDGAGVFAVFTKIVMPLSVPIMATVGLMTAIGYWNDWTNGLYYLTENGGSQYYTIQLVLNRINENINFLANNSDVAAKAAQQLPSTTMRMAIAVIGILPIMCAVFPEIFCQRHHPGWCQGVRREEDGAERKTETGAGGKRRKLYLPLFLAARRRGKHLERLHAGHPGGKYPGGLRGKPSPSGLCRAGLVAGYGYHSGRGGKTRDAGLDSG